MRSIVTQRLHLVPVREENAQALWHVLQQPDLRDFQDLPDLDATAFRRNIAQRPQELRPAAIGRFEWMVYWTKIRANGSPPIGWVSLRISERATETAEIGYSVVREHRGHGIATEAVTGLIDEGFERAGLAAYAPTAFPKTLRRARSSSATGSSKTASPGTVRPCRDSRSTSLLTCSRASAGSRGEGSIRVARPLDRNARVGEPLVARFEPAAQVCEQRLAHDGDAQPSGYVAHRDPLGRDNVVHGVALVRRL